VQELKIDKSFVIAWPATRATRLSCARPSTSRTTRLSVVAEGVEDDATLDRLRTMGCDMVQGYLPPARWVWRKRPCGCADRYGPPATNRRVCAVSSDRTCSPIRPPRGAGPDDAPNSRCSSDPLRECLQELIDELARRRWQSRPYAEQLGGAADIGLGRGIAGR
jgi:EAL domain-containing protein (putative c-di-GMP-specific phosphodiesterase class I)